MTNIIPACILFSIAAEDLFLFRSIVEVFESDLLFFINRISDLIYDVIDVFITRLQAICGVDMAHQFFSLIFAGEF